jgi:hypothetical protein
LLRNVSGELAATEASLERKGSLGLNGGMGILELFWVFMAQRVVVVVLLKSLLILVVVVVVLLRECDDEEEVEADESEEAMGKCRVVVAMVKNQRKWVFWGFEKQKWSGGGGGDWGGVWGWWVGLWIVRMGQSPKIFIWVDVLVPL